MLTTSAIAQCKADSLHEDLVGSHEVTFKVGLTSGVDTSVLESEKHSPKKCYFFGSDALAP